MSGKRGADRVPFNINDYPNSWPGLSRPFYHGFPFLDTSDSRRTKELKPIGLPTVIQDFGPKATRITIEGNVLEGAEVDHIRSLAQVEEAVPLVHEDWPEARGDVIVTDLETNRARGEHEIQPGPQETPRRVYYFKIEAVEAIELPQESPQNLTGFQAGERAENAGDGDQQGL